jgi:hypothetical protein
MDGCKPVATIMAKANHTRALRSKKIKVAKTEAGVFVML